jgi:hypothetical protein
MSSKDNWRNDPNMVSTTFYKKRFALFPIMSIDGEKVWLKNYYKKYILWGHSGQYLHPGGAYGHIDFIEDISEAEYIVRRLKEGF